MRLLISRRFDQFTYLCVFSSMRIYHISDHRYCPDADQFRQKGPLCCWFTAQTLLSPLTPETTSLFSIS